MPEPTPTPIPTPRRKRHRWGDLAVVGVLALVAVGMAVPGSPIYLPTLLQPEPKVDGRTAKQIAPQLADPDPAARRDAAIALGRLGTHASGSMPRLAELLITDPDADVRAAAADALGKMAPASEAVATELGSALADPYPRVRMTAALALSRLKEKARAAVPALIAAAADPDNDTDLDLYTLTVRQAVLNALGWAAAGTPDAVPTFTGILAKPSADATRTSAARGLGLAGPHAKPAAPRLRALLTDPSDDVRAAAGEALALLGEGRDGPTERGEFDNLELPDGERERLWEIEHRVNVLNRYGLAPLADAVAAADGKAVAALLAADFTGSEPGDAAVVSTTGFAAVDRRAAADKPVPLDGPQFVARLMEWRKLFTDPTVRIVTATLNPTDPAKPDGAWGGVVQVRLVGEAAGGGRAEVTASVFVEVTAATEKALSGPGWLRAAHVRQRAIARSPESLFVEAAAARGLDVRLHDNWTDPAPGGPGAPPTTNSGGVYVTDFDRDGYLDVLVVDLKKVALYRGGAGGRFTDVTAAVGLPRTGQPLAACWADLDGDGWDDLVMATRVYRNLSGAKFEDVTTRTGLVLSANTSAVLPADFDRDGNVDLYLTRTTPPGNQSWLEGVGNDGQGNRLVRNRGGWKFEDVTKKSGTQGGYRSTFTAAWLDADGDGWPDLHVPNEFGDGELLLNQKDGTFQPVRLADRPADFGTMGLAAGDIDNDGRTDIYAANMYSKAGTRVIGNLKPGAYPPAVMAKLKRFVAGSELHLNAGGGKFTQVGAERQLTTVGWAYGAALADLDADGFLDIYATAGYISRDRRKPDG